MHHCLAFLISGATEYHNHQTWMDVDGVVFSVGNLAEFTSKQNHYEIPYPIPFFFCGEANKPGEDKPESV